MAKRILLIGYNYHPEQTGIGKYNTEMICWLANSGYECEVITTYPYYPYWKIQEPYHKNRFWYKTERLDCEQGNQIKIHRCPMYVPSKPTGSRRMLLDLSFCISSFWKLMQLIPGRKFDCIIIVVPSFPFGLLGVIYKKLRKAKFVYHIQDMQIEAARDLGMISSKRILNFLFRLEKYIFNRADHVSSISEGMVSRIQAKAKKEVELFPNWTDTRLFRPVDGRSELKKEFGFKDADKIILYSGAIGEKQGLESILYTAQAYQDHQELKFLICGSGPYKEKMELLAEELKLNNIIFFPLQPFEKFNDFLNMADVHLVIQKANASDLVMPSKLTTILAVGGLAIITANEGSGLYELVSAHEMGILIRPEDPSSLIAAIGTILKSDYSKMNRNARLYAEQYLSIENILGAFVNRVLKD